MPTKDFHKDPIFFGESSIVQKSILPEQEKNRCKVCNYRNKKGRIRCVNCDSPLELEMQPE
jgi:formate dehydrogenase maturation protein FdhE